MEIDNTVITTAIEKLNEPLLNQDLGNWVSVYGKVSFYTETLLAQADNADTELKVAKAQVMLDKKESDPKASGVVLDAWAEVMTVEQQKAANKMRSDARKMAALRDAVLQAINAIKFLGKNDSVMLGGR